MFLRNRHKIYWVGFLHLMLILGVGCKTQYQVIATKSDHIRVQTVSDTTIPVVTERFLKPYRQKLLDSFSTVIATTTGDLAKKRPGGSLGNLVTKAIENYISYYYMIIEMRGKTPPTFVLMNYGGIRLNKIPKGSITVGKIYELLPFENTIVRQMISGKDLAQLLKDINNSGGWPIRIKEGSEAFKQMTDQSPNTYDKTHLTAESTISQIEKIDIISLFTINYLAQGGDNCSILKTLPQEDTGILLRDIVIDYLRGQKTITPDNTEYILK